MDLKQLQYFVTIADEGTISGAAKKLYLSQPPLSYQVRQLETELKCTLFERGARAMKLTDEGRLLYRKAIDLLEMSRVTKEEILSFSHSEQGTVRIGLVSSVVSTYGTKWISEFSGMHPEVNFEIYEDNTYELLNKLKSNTIHLAVLRSPYKESGYARHVIAEESMIAMGKTDLYRRIDTETDQIDMKTLSKLPLIVYRRWEKLIRDAFEAQKLPCHYLCICDDARTTAALAEHGMGIGIAPRSASMLVPKETTICKAITDLPLTSNIELIYHTDTYMPQCSRLFIEFMKDLSSHTA